MKDLMEWFKIMKRANSKVAKKIKHYYNNIMMLKCLKEIMMIFDYDWKYLVKFI